MVNDAIGLVPVKLDTGKTVYEGLIDPRFLSDNGVNEGSDKDNLYEFKVTLPDEVSRIDRLTVRRLCFGACITEMYAGPHKEEVEIPVVHIEKVEPNYIEQK